MKKIFTLCSFALLSIFPMSSSAQISENFDNGLATLAANCWEFNSMMYATNPSGFVVNGSGSLYSEPPVSADSVRIMRTPFLAVGTSIDVGFIYRLSNNLSGQATRFIKIDLVDVNGQIVQTLDSFSVTNSAANNAAIYNQTFAVNAAGIYRLSITMGGKTGAGNVRLSMDNLNVSSPVLGCSANAFLLPVHLVSFYGNLDRNNKVTLNWTIADNETANSFEVQKSENGKDFSTVAVVFKSEKTGTEKYMFYETINTTDKVMYRLKMIDKNHEADYSKTLIFQAKTTANSDIRIVGNPVNDKLIFSYNSTAVQSADVKVYDMTGKNLVRQKLNSLEGNNTFSLALNSTLKPGMYVVEVLDGNDRRIARFIKQ